MPTSWGALKESGDTGKGVCPDINDIYAAMGEWSRNNPSSGAVWLNTFFHLSGVGDIDKVGIYQNQSVEITVTGFVGGEKAIEKTYKRERGEFNCVSNAIIFIEDLGSYSVEMGTGHTKVTIELMLSSDNALIVHRLIEKKLRAPPWSIFTATDLDEYWYKYPVIK